MQIMQSNPEVAQMLNDPEMLRQSLAMARNPRLLQEMMRSQDRAIGNLEAHPEGFNALRRMYENVQEPMTNALMNQNATNAEVQANPAAAGPMGALFGAGLAQPPTSAVQPPAGSAPTAPASGDAPPSPAPLPNPWAGMLRGASVQL
jgi:ubiquilin